MAERTQPEVLIECKAISHKIAELGKAISSDFKGTPLTLIGISNGVVPFIADLMREIALPMQLDIVSASSYSGSESKGKVEIKNSLKVDIRNRSVILVDDILDTGRTLSTLLELLTTLQPKTIKTCVLLDKPARRVVDITADYIGFEVPDKFVVGYGLDYNEYYRNLPYIGTISPSEVVL